MTHQDGGLRSHGDPGAHGAPGSHADPPLVPVEEHVADVLAAIRPVDPVWVPLVHADGSVLAEDVTSTTPLPSFDNSAMDGYAVRAADLAGATAGPPVALPVRGEIAAGDTGDYRVEAGSCLQIMTGARMPEGADAVVPVEWTDGGTTVEASTIVAFRQAPEIGNAVRHRGDDVAEGTVLLPQGTLVGPVQMALLAASGHGEVLARTPPRVAIISTGNELVEPGTPLIPGQIWESNSFMLAAAARQAGAIVRRHRLRDDQAVVLSTLEGLVSDADLLITSGGVSMGGEHDVVKAALSKLGTITFRKVAMQPGMPQGFGVLGPDRTPIFTLPGNPVSAYVSFILFVQPALDALKKLSPQRQPLAQAALTASVRSPGGRRSYLRGILDPARETVVPLTGQSSHQLGALAQANALIIVPETVTRMEAGEGVDVMCLP
jgi:molybdopterin molybdotransferase